MKFAEEQSNEGEARMFGVDMKGIQLVQKIKGLSQLAAWNRKYLKELAAQAMKWGNMVVLSLQRRNHMYVVMQSSMSN